jgi:hypothetical protein
MVISDLSKQAILIITGYRSLFYVTKIIQISVAIEVSVTFGRSKSVMLLRSHQWTSSVLSLLYYQHPNAK